MHNVFKKMLASTFPAAVQMLTVQSVTDGHQLLPACERYLFVISFYYVHNAKIVYWNDKYILKLIFPIFICSEINKITTYTNFIARKLWNQS